MPDIQLVWFLQLSRSSLTLVSLSMMYEFVKSLLMGGDAQSGV